MTAAMSTNSAAEVTMIKISALVAMSAP